MRPSHAIVFALVVAGFAPPPIIGPSGSNGESVPNPTMNPWFLFELFHTTVVPALMQKNWLFLALGIPGFTLAELADLVMSIVHGDEAEPQVLAALHMLSGCASSHTYLLFFCACAAVQLSRTTQDNKSNALQMFNCCRIVIVIASLFAPRSSRFRRETDFAIVRQCLNESPACLSSR